MPKVFEGVGSVDFMRAGIFGPQLTQKIGSFRWADFFTDYYRVFKTIRELIESRYSFALIDSRTGLTDTSGICTMIMPEKLVAVFTPNMQSLDGVVHLLQESFAYRAGSDDFRPLTVFPLPSRIENVQKLQEQWRERYQEAFAELFRDDSDGEHPDLTEYFNRVLLPHKSDYAFGERIAIAEEKFNESGSLRKAYEEFFEVLGTWETPWLPPPQQPSLQVDDLRSAQGPEVHLPPRQARFIGREEEIDTLDQQLKEEGSLAYISGLGGRGKTTLALEYAHRHKAKFESVHWLPCQQRSLVQIAGELAFQLGLKLDGDLETIVHELNGHAASKRCLLIFDNVDDETPARLLPGGRTSVLVTTRVTNLRFLRGYRAVNLPLFTEEQCFELLRDVIGVEEVDRHAAAARTIFHKLGFLPIGISIVAALLHEDPLLTIEEMARNPPADVYALFAEAIAALTVSARGLLAAMAACAGEGFRLTLAAEISSLDSTDSSTVARELFSRSLVELLDKGTQRYRLHAMVRDAAGATADLRKKHALAVLNEFQQWETEWRSCEADMDDWQTAFAWLLSQSDGNAWSTAYSLAFLGFSLTSRLGRLPDAFEISERMTSEAERRGDDACLQAWLGNQALILKDWGRLDEALYLLQKKEAISLELGNRDGLQISYGNQALILKDWGRLDEALALHKKAEALCLELGNRDGLQASYGNQALILQDWGRLDEALALLQKKEAISLELGNRDGLGTSYGNQANILQSMGRLDEAMELLQKQEAICLDLNNRNGLAYCYWNWGMVAGKQGDRKSEREKLEQALALFTELKMPLQIKAVQDDLDKFHGNTA